MAALRLSGQDTTPVEGRTLAPKRVRVDRELAWRALARDKKAARGAHGLCYWTRPAEHASASSYQPQTCAPRSTS